MSDIGRRIAAARRRRGMSRRVLADLVGRSQEWLRLIETGQRDLDSIQIANRLYAILNLEGITGDPKIAHPTAVHYDHGSQKSVDAVRQAVLDSIAVHAFAPQSAWAEAFDRLETDVKEAWRRWLDGRDRYRNTLTLLPDLIRGSTYCLQDPTHAHPAIDAAMLTFYLTRTVMSRLGEELLAWLVADRGINAAESNDGPRLLASTWHLCKCYLLQGYFEEANRLALAAAEHARPTAVKRPQDIVILRGALLLLAAEAAAGMLDRESAQRLLTGVGQTAGATDSNTYAYMIPFGPTEVGISAVQVAIRLGQSPEAIRLASKVDIPDDYPPDRQARYYIPLAHLHAQRREDAAAIFALHKVAVVSPDDIRYDYLSRETLYRLLSRNNFTIRRELNRLCQMAGITT